METPTLEGFLKMVLALYLLPVLVIVLVVGTLGILVLAAGRFVAEVAGSRASYPRDPVGSEIYRS